jgi:hypothetical protein
MHTPGASRKIGCSCLESVAAAPALEAEDAVAAAAMKWLHTKDESEAEEVASEGQKQTF